MISCRCSMAEQAARRADGLPYRWRIFEKKPHIALTFRQPLEAITKPHSNSNERWSAFIDLSIHSQSVWRSTLTSPVLTDIAVQPPPGTIVNRLSLVWLKIMKIINNLPQR